MACGLLWMMTGVASAQNGEPVNLAVGDPARKDRVLSVSTDVLIDTATGAALPPAALADRLRDTKLLLLGESHTSAEFHRVQRQVIEALHRAGRKVTVGLEMYPYTQQSWLDRWSAGSLDEAAFVDGSNWYEHWGYHWAYYRDIFLFARERRIPMVAVNAPRDVVSAVRRRGFTNLTPEEAAHIPTDIDVSSADHLTLFKSYFTEGPGTHGNMSDDALKSMLNAQATWDATMGFNAVGALKKYPDPQAIVVVLVGSGHVIYGLGIERQVKRYFDGRVTTLVPVAIDPPASKGPADMMTASASTPATLPVRASFANFIWGVPNEPFPRYPELGLSARPRPASTQPAPATPAAGTTSTGASGTSSATSATAAAPTPPPATSAARPLQVLAVDADSPAGRAGVMIGDELVAVDGVPVSGPGNFNRLISEKEWGDVIELRVRRDGAEQTLSVHLQRIP